MMGDQDFLPCLHSVGMSAHTYDTISLKYRYTPYVGTMILFCFHHRSFAFYSFHMHETIPFIHFISTLLPYIIIHAYVFSAHTHILQQVCRLKRACLMYPGHAILKTILSHTFPMIPWCGVMEADMEVRNVCVCVYSVSGIHV